MFAGPNGSGKSSLKTLLPAAMQGVYINPDDLEAKIRNEGNIDFADYHLENSAKDALLFLRDSKLLRGTSADILWKTMDADLSRLHLGEVTIDSYLASALCEFIRDRLLQKRITFTFETVMSHPGKVALLDRARKAGYRTYLYYVATEDPLINISRVENRVNLGGHPVPHDKIRERYDRSLQLLKSAIRLTNRAYLFDNSGEGTGHLWIAEITDGTEIELKTDSVPVWFDRHVLEGVDSRPN